MAHRITILGIESSCDDTAAAIIRNGKILANCVAGQAVHEQYGGVVPELASRAHQQNIIPVVHQALNEAGISRHDLDGIAFTRGPGLLGSLLVGTSFTKGFALGLGIPMLEVNHMQAHILAHFIEEKDGSRNAPSFPFLCLTVSGGHTQIVRVDDYFEMTILGQTLDDAAGEAFDKAAKIMGLPYPGGPEIDRLAQTGNPQAFEFPVSNMDGLNFSFSGLKTSFLYFLRKQVATDPDFVEKNKADLAASIQHTIIRSLLNKLIQASEQTGISEIAIAGGVSANSGLRKTLTETSETRGWNLYIPKFQYCTDNAAMVAIAGYFKFPEKDFASHDLTPDARLKF